MIRVSVHGEDGVQRMARAAADGPDHLRENLGTAVRRAGRPVLRDAKRAIETNPIKGFRTGGRRYRGPHTPKGLRKAIAGVVDLHLNVGSLHPRATFTVFSYRLGERRRLPELIESGRVWRHPIMGRRGRGSWAGQIGKPWFAKTVERGRPLFERRVNEAVDRTARAIERSAG